MGVRPMQGGAGGVGKHSVNPEDVVTRNGKRLAACPSDAQHWRLAPVIWPQFFHWNCKWRLAAPAR